MKSLDFKSFLIGTLTCICFFLFLSSSNNLDSAEVEGKYEAGNVDHVTIWILDKETGIVKIIYANGNQRHISYEDETNTVVKK